MDQKRAWQKAVGKKRYLRILVAILSFCVLLTSLPSLPAALTVFAASEETDILPNNEKIPGGGVNDTVEDTPSTKQEEAEESGGTDETIVPDKNTDDTKGKEGGAGENTSPEEEGESEESQETDETTVPDKDADGTEEESGAEESTSPKEEDEETTDAGHEENGADAAVQTLLARIDALPDAEEYLAAEPDVEDEDAYAAWEEKLYECAEEALAIMEEYETLTEEQQAFISGEELAKLTAWTEIAELAGESAQVMAAASHSHNGISFDTLLPADGGKLTSGNYYLDGDVTLKDGISISSGEEVKLCLNGHTLNGPGLIDAVVLFGTLHVYDCQGGGVLRNDSTKLAIDNASGTFNLYGGTITNNGNCVITTNGTCNLSGGIVEGGSEEQILNSKTLTISGDAVVRGGKYAVYSSGRDTVLTVKGNAQLSGEEQGVRHSYGAFNIEGGTITGQKYGIYQGYYAGVSCLSGSPNVSGQEADLYLQTHIGTTLDNVKVDAVSYSGAALTAMEDSATGREGAYAIKVSEGNKDKFTLLNEGWLYAYKDGGLIIHKHSYKYKASTEKRNVVIESCTCGHEETATLSLQKDADLTYTGSGIKPVTVSYSDGWVGTGSARPDDSKIRYSYNINVGQATASLTIGLSAQASLDFTIAAAGMDDAAITLADGALTYNGQEQTKEVTNVKVNGRTLIPGTDYTIAGNTGTDAGEYTITVTGRMNYSGTKQITFQILRKTLTADMVTIASGPHYYTGKAVTSDITVRDDSTVLTDGTDYTVSYAANVNPGSARVMVAGEGNYTGTVNQTFTIECRELPSGNLTDYVDMLSFPNADGWYRADIVLTPKDGGSVGEMPASIGDRVVISEETGEDGGRKNIYIKDSAGNIYQTEFPYKLDKTQPVIDLSQMTVENSTKDLWNWIIGKKSMSIKIPAGDITDAPSGIEEVTYETVPDSGTGQSGTLHAKEGYYEIALNAEFSGTIRLVAKDKAGNTTQVSLTAAGGKVIAEDYAPIVNFTLPNTPQPNADGWYSEAFDIAVTVTDDQDSGNHITSGGIAEIKWKDGESGPEQTIAELPGTAPVYSKTFTIPVDTDGTHTYYVQATDNAGNESGWQTVTVRLDTGSPEFSGDVSATNRTQEGADITFTPSEGGKAYWIVSDTGTAPSAQEVVAGAQGGAGKGGVRDVTGSTPDTFTVTGLTPGEKHTVYVVLEDAAGNLSVVKEVTFTTLQKAPEITLRDLDIDYEKETVKLPDSFGDAEVYTNPDDPAGSMIQPETDGSLPVEPGTPVYIRYPEKTEGGETTPASVGAKIDIPGRPAAPAPKKTAVTDTTVTVTDPAAGEEYILVEKGSLPEGADPDWDNADKVNETGVFTGLAPNKEYELYVRKKATQDHFASGSAKTEVRTYVTIEESNVTGEGAGQTGNTALTPDAPDGDGDTVTFTGTYGEEYTPVIKVDGKEIVPGEGTPGSEMTWDGNSGEWKYTYEIPGGASNVQITVEFRKRVVTGIAAAPDSLTIYADDAANGSMEALTAYLKDHCNVQTVYDNQTKEIVQEKASFVTTDSFVQKGTAYHYTVSAGGRTCTAALTVQPLTASVQNPDTLRKKRKNGGYTAQEVGAWLPAQVTVTYTGTGYTARTETRAALHRGTEKTRKTGSYTAIGDRRATHRCSADKPFQRVTADRPDRHAGQPAGG